MIPRASARRLETTLVSYSRQSLPRPARFYSTPTKKANAPALAQATLPDLGFDPFVPKPKEPAVNDELQRFLGRRPQFTMLPTPLPDDRSSALNDFYFPDSPTQDLVAVMDACMHNLYDVPRATQIFENMRRDRPGEPLLDTRVYNSFLEAFIEMATTKGQSNRDYWVNKAWTLFGIMDDGKEKVVPTAGTYATMLIAWLRFHTESPTPVMNQPPYSLKDILFRVIDRDIPITAVVADRVLTSSKEASDIIQMLSSAAADMNLMKVVVQLGQARDMGSFPNPLADVDEVRPVLRAKQRDVDIEKSEDGTVLKVTDAKDEPEMEIPFNLENLRKHLAQLQLARRVLPEDVTARQTLLEASVHEVAIERFRHEDAILKQLGLGNTLHQRNLQAWMWTWHQALEARLVSTIKDIVSAEQSPNWRPTAKTPIRLGQFLSLVKADRVSLITILELMRLTGSGGINEGMKTARALLAVGKGVENEYKAQMCRKNKIFLPNNAKPGDHGFYTRFGYQDLHARRVVAAKYMEDAEEWTAEWTTLVRVRVGSILVDSLMDVATVERSAMDKMTGELVTETQPAFFHSYEYSRGHKLGVIKLNPAIANRIAEDGLRETLHPRHLPMLVKPKPWITDEEGGYLNNKTSVMRFKDSLEQKAYLRHATEAGSVELVFAGLDVLGSTPWKINRSVFDVVLKVWNSGERLCKVPPALYDRPEPERPPNIETDIKVKSVYGQRLRAFAQAKANNHSDRCSVNYKIEIARAFLGDTFYLPHNLDFRGRAYPIPPHLNHLGDDLSRGLLMFGEAKALGERGMRWLKIHLANLYGFDKGDFNERENFVMQHLSDIYDSAEKPLEGRRWWIKADDPWQCLATCMELRAALESEDPHTYMSSLPVHQDGTCNGLQHYAALGGDDQGARQVNLGVTDRPSDVYTFVANMVEKQVELDIQKGDKYARIVAGKVSRKVVKQTVMTTVYGVTFIGAREQIERQLKDRKDISEEECWSAASYLARKTLACIGDLFRGAKSIQTWLNLCARLISKSIPADRIAEAMETQTQRRGAKAIPIARLKKEQMTSVVWTTPLGLPIVQPYRKPKRKQIMTSLQTVFISDPNSPAEVNCLKQASAFPPNFIHSLDATHMMLTALECRTQNLTFASVHDSYWTHASSIDKMSEIIRDTFIALHSSDVLGKLEYEIQERYAGYKIALSSLRTGKFMTQLAEAGTTITASPDQAKRLRVADAQLESLLTVSETEKSSIDEKEVDFGGETTDLEAKPKRRKSKTIVEDPDAAAAELKDIRLDEADKHLLGKFVELRDLLPPLPKKGNFNVETIKGSQYFFS
ncbi:hypothetical protein PILCRDRAFT_812715 [Piloderma croceum F 1598]|uniref:DNA-directed RNA polymerase n=1 Tax=Piloderma croceum (strain F 1598) TaxID=765440 RepID=A0A0C3BTP2_PILCF|nr:hypothetical protein PILCRDRAFT_812715 [Piloderma croceum F 1598]